MILAQGVEVWWHLMMQESNSLHIREDQKIQNKGNTVFEALCSKHAI